MSKADNSIKILFAEDLQTDLELAQREIRKGEIAFSHEVVDTEEEFRRALKEFKPDVIISDYSMPSFDGMAALKITRSLDRNIPFIVLTGSMNEETAVACMKAGANDYVIKEHLNRLPYALIEALENSRARVERERIEKELQESERKFRNIFENHVAIKLIIDPDNGNIVEANRAAAEFYGWTVEELERMKIYSINTLPEEQINVEMEKVRKREKMHFEFSHRLADGSERFIESFSSSVNIAGKEYLHSIIHDVTGKKKAEEQLRLLNRSVEQSRVSIVITDKKGEIEYVNPFFTALTGYSLEEAKRTEPSILKSGHQPDELYQELWDTVLSGNEWNGELLSQKKDGSLYWESAIVSPVFDNKGDITHFVGVKEDITEKKKMIEELVVAKEKAEESDRLKSAFLANMSHEIRTPLNGILGFVEFLKDPGITPEEREQYISIIRESSERLTSTISDLVEISKIESGIMELQYSDADINSMLEYLYRLFKQEADKKSLSLTMDIDLPEHMNIINTDKYKLESIISNFLKNAVKFTHEGFIKLSCSMNDDNQLHFVVEDSGAGIPGDKKGQVFNRFVQADLENTRPYEGSGLGLSIAKAYADLLNADIGVDSEEGKGSAFYLLLPVEPDSGEKKKPEQSAETIPRADNTEGTILIVEDDRASTAYLDKVLSSRGYKLLFAVNGEEAVSICRETPGIDLVLMDIKMPVLDGYDATREIRKFNKDVPVIAQTAYAFSGDAEKAMEAGCNDYISKPVKQADLLKLVGSYM
ncbi:MAG: response regulator [Bacteroidota bacterium]